MDFIYLVELITLSLISMSKRKRYFLPFLSWLKYTKTTIIGSLPKRAKTHKDYLQLLLRINRVSY
jgi:hypothetical protein